MDLQQLAYRLANRICELKHEDDKKEVELHVLRALNHISFRKEFPREEVKTDE